MLEKALAGLVLMASATALAKAYTYPIITRGQTLVLGAYALTLPAKWTASYEQTAITEDDSRPAQPAAADEPVVMTVQIFPLDRQDHHDCTLYIYVDLERGFRTINPEIDPAKAKAIAEKMMIDDVAELRRLDKKAVNKEIKSALGTLTGAVGAWSADSQRIEAYGVQRGNDRLYLNMLSENTPQGEARAAACRAAAASLSYHKRSATP